MEIYQIRTTPLKMNWLTASLDLWPLCTWHFGGRYAAPLPLPSLVVYKCVPLRRPWLTRVAPGIRGCRLTTTCCSLAGALHKHIHWETGWGAGEGGGGAPKSFASHSTYRSAVNGSHTYWRRPSAESACVLRGMLCHHAYLAWYHWLSVYAFLGR